MKFTPLTEAELLRQTMQIQEGPVDFCIQEANEKISSAGNNMIEMKLKVYDSEGIQALIFDYITPHSQWRIKQLLESVGYADVYEKGEVPANFLVGLNGKAFAVIQKDKKGVHPPKPVIKYYMKNN